jgi:hypothetical protein
MKVKAILEADEHFRRWRMTQSTPWSLSIRSDEDMSPRVELELVFYPSSDLWELIARDVVDGNPRSRILVFGKMTPNEVDVQGHYEGS